MFLSRRKQEFQRAQDEQSGSQFSHKLLEEGEPNKFFRCTVQASDISRSLYLQREYEILKSTTDTWHLPQRALFLRLCHRLYFQAGLRSRVLPETAGLHRR